MRLIFIRHAEPDYSCDGLTDKGKREAQLLAKRVSKWDVDRFYVSPMGRAIDTAAPSLRELNREAITVPWLREFSYPVENPTHGRKTVCWDFIPSDWTGRPEMFTMTDWLDVEPAVQNPDLKKMYGVVTGEIDRILEEYGYRRNGYYYKALNPKNRRFKSTVIEEKRHVANELGDDDAGKTVVFFCHFGVTMAILSYLLNIPFPLLVQGTIVAPTGITILSTEERWDDEAAFRLQVLGDVSHLTGQGEPISGAGSFTPLFQL